MYPTDEETFDGRVTPEWVRQGHLNSIQVFLKRIQDFLGYGGRLHDKTGLVVPVGVMFEWPAVDAPSGFLLCDGKEYLRAHADYSDLFAVIGTKYGARISTLFNVPDRRGYFTRGYSKMPSISFVPGDVNVAGSYIILEGSKFHRTGFPVRFTTEDTLPAPLAINTTYFTILRSGVSFGMCASRADAFLGIEINITNVGVGNSYVHPYIEEDKDSRLKLADGGNDGEDLGSYQDDALQGHYHRGRVVGASVAKQGGDSVGPTTVHTNRDLSKRFDCAELMTDASGVYGVVKKAIETRVRNVNVNYIIKR